MNKLMITASLVVVVAIGVWVGVFLFKPSNQPKTLPPVCDPYLNIEAVVASGKVDSCECLGEEAKVKDCQINLKDLIIYNQIPQTFDPVLCGQIVATSTKENCLGLIKDRNDFIEQHKGQSLPESNINK